MKLNRILQWMALAAMPLPVHAQPTPTSPAQQDQQLSQEIEEDAARGLLNRDFLTGDWGGARTALSERYGINPFLTYTGEVLGNPSGGIRQGTVYNGLVDMGVEINLETMTGGAWKGATLFANAYQIHGQSLTENYTGDLFVLNNISAPNEIRLAELFFEQNFWRTDSDRDIFSLRFGQLLADSEFAISQFAGLFLNSTFGWPGGIAANAPTPAYPVAALGARLRVEPTDNTYVMGAIYQGDAYPFDDQGKAVNNHGTYWNLNEEQGIFGIFEAGYKLNQQQPKHMAEAHHIDPKAMDGKKMMVPAPRGLPGEYKIGGWFHTGTFDALDVDENGFPLDSPLTNGTPGSVNGTWGLYVIADQMLYMEDPGAYEEELPAYQGLGAFFRFFYADSQVAFFNASSEFGLTYTGLIPGRDSDALGVGFAYSGITDDIGRVSRNTGGPNFDWTAALEVTYQIELTPWWILQPDFQYIFQPDGASTGSGGLQDAVVLGLRTEIAF